MEMIIDYPVEGCWSGSSDRKCRCCGSTLELVPKGGHFNSRYWELKRNDGMYLYCCPKGCSEKEAEKKAKRFLAVREFCTEDSTYHDWRFDLNSFSDAWINRSGTLFPVVPCGHQAFADSMNKSEWELEQKGWAKISDAERAAMCPGHRGFSKKQLNALFDFCVVRGLKTEDIMGATDYFSLEEEV